MNPAPQPDQSAPASPDSPLLGIEIGGTKLQVVAGDAQGRIHRRERFTVNPAQGATGIRLQIEQALTKLLPLCQPHARAVGVGFGGPVHHLTGHISRSHQIEGWSDFNLQDWLQSHTGLPVTVDNDANLAALGEARNGAGRDADPVFYVTLGSGVGGGLIVNGQVYHGAAPGESEIGHLRLDRSGTIVEQRCSGWAVDNRIRELAQSHPNCLLHQLAQTSPGGEAKHLATALEQGDPIAQTILRETAENLAFALSHVTHLFHPEVIVLGGGLSHLGEPLRQTVADALPTWIMQVFGPGPQIRLAQLGEDAVPVGCLLAAGAKAQGAS